MKLRKISSDFTPLHQGLLFGIDTESDTPSDLVVEIINVATDEVLATQLLRGVVTAEVNVAPYLAPFTEYVPDLYGVSGFKEAPTRECAIRVGDEMSDTLLISTNKSLHPAHTMVTAMPKLRSISRGEIDELLFLGEREDNFAAIIKTDTNDYIDLDYTTVTGAAILTISPDDFNNDVSSIEVEVSQNGFPLATLRYTLRSQHKGGCRLAWLSEEGSIERYTFPVVTKRVCKADKLHIGVGENRRVVRSSLEEEFSLVSRYEPRATIESLAHIISATRVWIEHPLGHREVAIKSSVIDSNLFGEPVCIELVISEYCREEAIL